VCDMNSSSLLRPRVRSELCDWSTGHPVCDMKSHITLSDISSKMYSSFVVPHPVCDVNFSVLCDMYSLVALKEVINLCVNNRFD